VKEFSDLVKTWEIPESQNAQLVEKWTRFQQVFINLIVLFEYDHYFL